MLQIQSLHQDLVEHRGFSWLSFSEFQLNLSAQLLAGVCQCFSASRLKGLWGVQAQRGQYGLVENEFGTLS